MDFINELEIINENLGNTMFLKCGQTDVLCKIVGFSIEENKINKDKEELFVLCYREKSNGVDFPKGTLSNYNILFEIKDAKEENYIKVPYGCIKIFNNKLISAFA